MAEGRGLLIMDQHTREQNLKRILKNSDPYSYKDLTYKTDKARKMPIYEIPVEFLIFNQHNGRIGTYVKTYEKQFGPIDASLKEGEEIIVKFLWASKKKRNKETLDDIKIKGQLEPGIVTRDGVVVDGNRRCMLLKMAAEENNSAPTYFKAVVLDDTLEDNPKEIRKLETIYQMGVDEKVDYNPIEKYLKCQDLSSDFKPVEIAKFIGESKEKVKEYLEILKLMESYLGTYGYEGIYTILDEESVEGPFVDLRRYLEKQKSGRGIRGRDWSPNEEDIDDLKNVYFDYIRAGFRAAQNIRNIGNPSKGQGFFNKKSVWDDFQTRYEKEIEPICEQEKTFEEWRSDLPDENLTDVIKSRDHVWKNKVEQPMHRNIGVTKRQLDDENEADSPIELLERAKRTLSAVNTEIEAFRGDEIRNISHEIRKITEDFIKILRDKEKNR